MLGFASFQLGFVGRQGGDGKCFELASHGDGHVRTQVVFSALRGWIPGCINFHVSRWCQRNADRRRAA